MASLRIGVDVGGTNTDGVLLDPTRLQEPTHGILAWHKTPTTADPSSGIEDVIAALFQKADVDSSSIASVTIGTTHFINAVLEKDQNRLAPVAVLRLCGPFALTVSAGIDWPDDLRRLICVYQARLKGGLEVDGNLIGDIDEDEIAEHARIIKAKGIRSIVINGVFSPVDIEHLQEERARDVVLKVYPEVDVVISKEVANLGFVERENAAILNASILRFAQQTIAAFRRAMTGRLNLACPIFLTQNDGTIMPAHLAARLPIRTFASGSTNSMCGARFLAQSSAVRKEAILVVDIGGTSTDAGMLLPSGFPRQAAAFTELVGIRMNFSCPDVKSIALGGGSIIRKTASGLTIGPDSVGHCIQEQALVFGGEVPTTTDYTVASYGLKTIGDASKVEGALPDLVEYQTLVKHMLEDIVDKMKTSAEDIPVLLVGGGAIIAPEALAGASKVIKPEYAGVANAIGAAMARVSGAVDTVVSTAGKSLASVFEEISKMAIDRAVANGAARETVHIAERDAFPLPYIANKSRVIVKAVGDLDFTKVRAAPPPDADDLSIIEVPDKRPLPEPTQPSTIDIKTYRPKVLNREWFISELDLTWIACGCYILGTGGGGSPYPEFIEVREMMRTGAVVRVIDPQDLADDAVVACGGSMGSPTVSMEKLPGPEIMEAQNALYGYLGIKADAVMALEIGGGNGLQGLLIGASTNMNVPVVDGDWMGRAYPTGQQVTPVVYEDGPLFFPQVIADGNGNQMMFLKATSEEMMERAFRAALAEMGSSVACARGPYPGHKTKKQIVAHTVSLAWRIGRAVALCRQSGGLDAVAEAIVDEVGGRAAAKVLFKGKIVGVERRLFKGHSYGELIIEAADVAGTGEAPFRGRIRIPFKNENIFATVEVDGEEEEVVASVPDLVSVLDAQNGEALGTPEYRYGLFVVVIGITASPHWTSTERGLALGGPRAFDMDVVYKPLGVFSQPRSVVEEFS